MASDRFTSIKELTSGNAGKYSGYTTDPSKLYGGVFGNNLSFPTELGSSVNNHYMIFFINELAGGKYKEQVQRRLSTDSPVILQKQSTSNMKNVANTVGKVFDDLAPTYKRSSVCIALPVPEVLNTAYDAQWGAVDAPLMNLVSAGINVADIIKNSDSVTGGVWDAVKAVASRQTVAGFSKFAANIMGDAGNQITKSSNNTRREVMFDSLMPRRFSFTWTLYPKSAEESKAVWDIIQMFKYHMLPEYDEETFGLFINFPNTFDIEVHSNGKRNNWLPKTSTCALTRMDLNYTPGGSYAFFEEIANGKDNYPDGSAPVGVVISLEFAEIELIYRNRIDPEAYDAGGGNKGSASEFGAYSFGNSKEYKQRPDGGTL